ncbi:hypothetical protein [Paludibaculum fermentans]|uniref:Uncharacterized protein n=1 Tax=Paludibaculum fermentans TaxID=1473598 RepID=A0A7S7NQW3_PALFE|nr:hypothetical protein [Paludibaculum fermentans]QOY88046.1 hypothetical protein IRI77_35815 [Paludibaculum fermentans]
MKIPGDSLLCLVLVAVFAAYLGFSVRRPDASRNTQLAVLAVVTATFFLVCSFLLAPTASF